MLELNKKVKLIFESPKDKSYKFGYYNICPFNKDDNKLLAHLIDFEGRLPTETDEVKIGYFDLENSIWVELAKTSAFNWQQGSMLQWKGPDYNTTIIFNEYKEGNYISKEIDITTKVIKEHKRAIYGVVPSGEKSVTINFERCNYTRAYSYSNQVDKKWKFIKPEEDGVYTFRFKDGEFVKIVNLADLVKNTSIESDKHWVEHVMLNPSGSRVAFYHRMSTPKGFYTDCYTVNLDGTELWRLPISETEQISHLGWKTDEEFVVFTKRATLVNKLWVGKETKKIKDDFIRKLYRKVFKPLLHRFIKTEVIKDSNSKYYFYKDMVGKTGQINSQPKNMDGHPSFSKCGNFMLTDTYADQNNYRHLVLFNLSNNTIINIAKFKSYFNNTNWRCDLHPRFSHNEKMISVDVNLQGITQTLVLDISELIR
jgi:hypothetical protein